jgi:hypothetical protein
MGKQVKEFQEKELAFLKEVQAMQTKEAELEIELQRKLNTERESLKAQIQKEEAERLSLKDQEHSLKVKELEKKLEDQQKLADEMRRKAEQGSMQMQGEVQELLLEELLKSSFPFDQISEVGKGVRGADCIQTVRNSLGQEAGKIIYESKRTTAFSQEWIEKLKADMRSQGADIAVIVTQTFPKDMDRFGEKDGVYICSFQEVKSVALLLRNAICELERARVEAGVPAHAALDVLRHGQAGGAVAGIGILAGKEFLGDRRAELPAILPDHDERHEARADVQRKRAAEGAGVLHHDAGVAHLQDAQAPDQVVPARVIARDGHLERPALLAELFQAASPFVRARACCRHGNSS